MTEGSLLRPCSTQPSGRVKYISVYQCAMCCYCEDHFQVCVRVILLFHLSPYSLRYKSSGRWKCSSRTAGSVPHPKYYPYSNNFTNAIYSYPYLHSWLLSCRALYASPGGAKSITVYLVHCTIPNTLIFPETPCSCR
jgi:hypothetical protein